MPRASVLYELVLHSATVRFQVPKCEFVTPDRKLLNLRADASPATSTSSSPYSLRSPRRVLQFSPREGRFAMHLATIGNAPSPLLHAQTRSICGRSSNAASSLLTLCIGSIYVYGRAKQDGMASPPYHTRSQSRGHCSVRSLPCFLSVSGSICALVVVL